MNYKGNILILTTVLFTIIGSYCWAQDGSSNKSVRPYRIVESKDYSIRALTEPFSTYSSTQLMSLPMNIRKIYKIIVPSDISKEELKASMKYLVKQEITKNPDIDDIAVFAYDRKEDSEGAYTFGKMEWCPNGNWAGVTSYIASSNDRSSYKYVFDIMGKVGNISADDIPTKQEFVIFDAYQKLRKPFLANPDLDEEMIMKRVAKKLGISKKKLNKIYFKVLDYNYKD